MDLHVAGDRLAACKAGMQPIGFTHKRTRKKYRSAQHGEMMIIHQCTDCSKISFNRVAADDDLKKIMRISKPILISNDQPAWHEYVHVRQVVMDTMVEER
jgi:hypothetical protein